tara:strand:- start:954 stop:4169 length:3216 start_codon:yes stop_codon:yes gene_type:complete
MKLIFVRFTTLAFLLLFFSGFISSRKKSEVEFGEGRTPPPKNNLPVLGSGFAMSKGYYRGSPVGELSGWTLSLWFEVHSTKKGDLFGIVSEPTKGRGFRLTSENGSLIFSDNTQKRKPWSLRVEGISQETWHHLVLSYDQASGLTFYLDGEKILEGRKGQMGHATKFDNYHFGAAVLGGDKVGYFFDGLIDDFSLFNLPFDESDIQRLREGKDFKDSLVAFNDFENVDHQKLAFFDPEKFDENYLEKGKELYQLNCIACHSKDGVSPPPNPLSRMFTKNIMENGGDPYSMFRTLTYGFRNMMPSVQLKPAERYQVIHYLRQRVIKEKAPELLVEINKNYIQKMPKSPDSSSREAKRIEELAKSGYLRDYGKALISPVVGNAKSSNALTINLGDETTISYDLGTMRSIGAWTGGFLDLSETLHHKLRAGGLPSARFEMIMHSKDWGWAWDGKAENQAPDLFPRTVWPEEQIRYRGHYPHGENTILSYTVQKRGVLESPILEKTNRTPLIHHRLSIEPGKNSLELIILREKHEIKNKQATARHCMVWLQAQEKEIKFRSGKNDELILQIPPSDRPLHLNLAMAFDESDELEKKKPCDQVVNLHSYTKGGERRWKTTHELKGRLETSTFQGYTMDSVTVPLKNNYNSWMRTSSLAFFPDGRLAVGTLPGDIWIVSGINEELDSIRWQRFAAGLYEPLGMKVVDGVLTAITRGRIVKLHDYNKDGEADFYEAFFNEDEPSQGWHAYNFDLEVGEDGSYYYGRTGGFSQWSIPGGIVCVSPDGKSSKVVGVGLRVPNGIGRLPDGRITLGDNQGTYVPASKISITSPDAFHGAGSWNKHGEKYDPKQIVQPIVYMPQELDSSSGGQLWVRQDDRLGPLSGQYFHTSYGKAATMYVMLDNLKNATQGAVYSLPLKMESGTMRAAKNPIDGQLYFSGLTGWQAGATREGSIQRLRYTGEKGIYLKEAKAREGRLELTFTESIDPNSIDLDSFSATAWNYRWSKGYGSPTYKLSTPEVRGIDEWEIHDTKISHEGRKVIVGIPELNPCHNLKLEFSVRGKNGAELSGPVYFTIHELPES